ncbi:MAG: AbrB family transcriptional regulator [Pseudomonadota bacterium]
MKTAEYESSSFRLIGRLRKRLQVGHKIQVMVYEGRMELIPFRPIRQARCFLKGIDTDVEREVDRP